MLKTAQILDEIGGTLSLSNESIYAGMTLNRVLSRTDRKMLQHVIGSTQIRGMTDSTQFEGREPPSWRDKSSEESV